ncbi:SH3 domain-containing protein, partial [Tritonibacter horizontis]
PATASGDASGQVADTHSDTDTDTGPEMRVTLRNTPTKTGTAPAQPLGLAMSTNGLQIGSLQGGLGAISAAASDTTRGNSSAKVISSPPAPPQDFREIRASRANVRLGPSTEFPVMAQLLAGDRVRVLDEDPSGWALLENPRTGDVGWIAASLLSAKGS